MYTPQKETGALVGTGSDLYVELGFKPDFIEVINKTKTTKLTYVEGVTFKTAGTLSAGTTITVDERGFTIPAAENTASDEIVYAAFG